MSNTKDSKHEDDALWQRIQEANTPTRAEMTRAELELQALEPDPEFAVDGARLSTAAAPAQRRSGRAKLAALAAGLLLMSALAVALGDQRSGRLATRDTFNEYLDHIEMPHQYTTAQQAVGPVGTTAIRCAQAIQALSGHTAPAVAEAARRSLERLEQHKGHIIEANHESYVDARLLVRGGKGEPAALLQAITDLESVCATATGALMAFDAPEGSQAAQNAQQLLSRISQVTGSPRKAAERRR